MEIDPSELREMVRDAIRCEFDSFTNMVRDQYERTDEALRIIKEVVDEKNQSYKLLSKLIEDIREEERENKRKYDEEVKRFRDEFWNVPMP